MEINEIVKDIFKSKAMAKFSHYVSGNLYYNVESLGGIYQFPIATVEERRIMIDGNDEMDGPADAEYLNTLKLSTDLGTTAFNAEMKGSELNRWIKKANEKGEFIKVG